MREEISWTTTIKLDSERTQPTPILQEPSSHSMNLQGSLWVHWEQGSEVGTEGMNGTSLCHYDFKLHWCY